MFCMAPTPNPAVDCVIPGNALAGDPGVGFWGTRDARLPEAKLPGKPVLAPPPGTPQDFGIPKVSAGSSWRREKEFVMFLVWFHWYSYKNEITVEPLYGEWL